MNKMLSFLVIMCWASSNILFGAGDKKVRFLDQDNKKTYGSIAQHEQLCPGLVISQFPRSVGTQTDCQSYNGPIIKNLPVCRVDDMHVQASKTFRSMQTQVAWTDMVWDGLQSIQVEKPSIKKPSEKTVNCLSVILNCIAGYAVSK